MISKVAISKVSQADGGQFGDAYLAGLKGLILRDFRGLYGGYFGAYMMGL